MRRLRTLGTLGAAMVVVLLAIVPGVGAAQATHTDYTFDSVNFPLDDPFAYITHEANGWFFLADLPIGGNYVSSDLGPAWLQETVYGKISSDFGAGSFHGPVTLTADGVACAGRFNAQRADFVETGRWLMHCDDGTTRRATWQFDVLTDPDGNLIAPWFPSGSGTSLSPHG